MIHANAFQTCRLQEGNKCFGEQQSTLVHIVFLQSPETAWTVRRIYDEYNMWHNYMVMNSSGAGSDTLGHFLEFSWAFVSTQSPLQTHFKWHSGPWLRWVICINIWLESGVRSSWGQALQKTTGWGCGKKKKKKRENKLIWKQTSTQPGNSLRSEKRRGREGVTAGDG